MDTSKLTDTLKIVANIMRCLHLKGKSGFSEMMEQLGLDTKADCGTFGYHLSELQRSGFIQRDRKGLYSLTGLGERVWSAMEQTGQKMGENIPSVSITRFREEDVTDLARCWISARPGVHGTRNSPTSPCLPCRRQLRTSNPSREPPTSNTKSLSI